MANYTSIHTGQSIDAAVTAALKAKESSGGRLQLVGTHGAIPNGIQAGNASGRSDVIELVECDHTIGREDVTGLRLATTAVYLDPGGAGEVAMPNGFNWEAAIEVYNPVNTFQSAFVRGQQVIPVAAGTPIVMSEPVGFDVPKNARITSRQQFTIAATADKFPTSSVRYKGNSVTTPSTTKKVADIFSFTPGGNDISASGPTPLGLYGIPRAPMVALQAIGDSLSNGRDDTVDATGNHGFISKGLANVNGSAMPWQRATVNGWQMSTQVVTATLGSRWRQSWQYLTHILNATGTNDIANGRTLAQMQADAIAIWTAQKRTLSPYDKPLHVSHATVMPRCTNAAGTTPATNFGAGQLRDQWNTWLFTQVGQGLLDAVVDVAAAVSNPSNPAQFRQDTGANPTTDGVHIVPALHILSGNAINTWAAGLTV